MPCSSGDCALGTRRSRLQPNDRDENAGHGDRHGRPDERPLGAVRDFRRAAGHSGGGGPDDRLEPMLQHSDRTERQQRRQIEPPAEETQHA